MADAQSPGCLARTSNAIVGSLLLWMATTFLLELPAKEAAGCTKIVAGFAALAVGGLCGFLLPELIAGLRRAGISERRLRVGIEAVAASIVTIKLSTLGSADCLSFPVAICAVAFLLLFLSNSLSLFSDEPAAVSPSATRQPVRLIGAAKSAVLEIVKEVSAGAFTGFLAGFWRGMLGRSAITGWLAISHIALITSTFMIVRHFVSAILNHGRPDKKAVVVVDGLLLGFLISAATMGPVPKPIWGNEVASSPWLFLILGPILGSVFGGAFGSLVGSLMLAWPYLVDRTVFSSIWRLANGLLRVTDRQQQLQQTAEPLSPASHEPLSPSEEKDSGRDRAGDAAHREERRRVFYRKAALPLSLFGFLFCTSLALVLSAAKVSQDDEDTKKLPLECPRNCRALECPNCSLARVSLIHADLTEANLLGSLLYYSNLSGSTFIRGNLRGANLNSAYLYGADLSEADLSRANLTFANFENTNLWSANLEGAELHGTNFLGADLTLARLHGATYDESTVWPQGFDPGVTGAVLE